MRRTLERSQRARPKSNRWSWGGALHTNTPSTPAGTLIIYFLLNGLSRSADMSACRCVCTETFHIPCPLLLLLTHALLCLSLSFPLTFKLFLTLSTLLSDLPLLSLCHCPLPSWSRFCRVGFALSTRPCRTGAHAECFQSLPQIRNDLSM